MKNHMKVLVGFITLLSLVLFGSLIYGTAHGSPSSQPSSQPTSRPAVRKVVKNVVKPTSRPVVKKKKLSSIVTLTHMYRCRYNMQNGRKFWTKKQKLMIGNVVDTKAQRVGKLYVSNLQQTFKVVINRARTLFKAIRKQYPKAAFSNMACKFAATVGEKRLKFLYKSNDKKLGYFKAFKK